jgi:hypothetical protein
MPFGDTVIVAQITGLELLTMLAYGTRNYPNEFSGLPHLSGLKYTIDLDFSWGDPVQRIKSPMRVGPDGTELGLLDTTANYKLALADFLKDGGDGYTMLPGLREVRRLGNDVDMTKSWMLDHTPIDISDDWARTGGFQVIGTGASSLLPAARIVRSSVPVRGVLNAPRIDVVAGLTHFYDFKVEADILVAADEETLDALGWAGPRMVFEGMIIGGRWSPSTPEPSVAPAESKGNSGWIAAAIASWVVTVAVILAVVIVILVRWRRNKANDAVHGEEEDGEVAPGGV